MSLNDPQWGKRGRSGPPDLDEIWHSVNRRLNELFGRREPDGGGDGGDAPRFSFPFGGVGLLIALMLVVWLASSFYIVDEGRQGVVTRFGKYTETTGSGLHWHLPYPVESVEVIDFSKIKTVEIHGNTPASRSARGLLLVTDDENIIDALFNVQYRLKDAKDFVFNTDNFLNPLLRWHIWMLVDEVADNFIKRICNRGLVSDERCSNICCNMIAFSLLCSSA